MCVSYEVCFNVRQDFCLSRRSSSVPDWSLRRPSSAWGTCPTLGCIFPPDQTDFLAGQLFDIRLEIHAPLNGTEASNNGVPNETFSLCIQRGKEACTDVTKYFKVSDSALEKWDILVWLFVVCARISLTALPATMKTFSLRMPEHLLW